MGLTAMTVELAFVNLGQMNMVGALAVALAEGVARGDVLHAPEV